MTATARQDDAFYRSARPRLFALAYRMLGQVSEAEDMVQEAFLRWRGVAAEEVRDPLAYLLRVTARLCLDQLKSARRHRELYVGEWLPEPVATGEGDAGLDHDVTVALLLALERLTPLERAAFILHDVFEVPHDEVAQTVGRSAAACRQLAARARRQVQQDRPRAQPEPARGDALIAAFFTASKTGDTATLTQLLAEDVRVITDGGGKVPAAINPILGRAKALRFFAGLARKGQHRIPERWTPCALNALPAVVSIEPGDVLQATAIEVNEDGITAIYITRNPDKTRHLAALLDSPRATVGSA